MKTTSMPTMPTITGKQWQQLRNMPKKTHKEGLLCQLWRHCLWTKHRSQSSADIASLCVLTPPQKNNNKEQKKKKKDVAKDTSSVFLGIYQRTWCRQLVSGVLILDPNLTFVSLVLRQLLSCVHREDDGQQFPKVCSKSAAKSRFCRRNNGKIKNMPRMQSLPLTQKREPESQKFLFKQIHCVEDANNRSTAGSLTVAKYSLSLMSREHCSPCWTMRDMTP